MEAGIRGQVRGTIQTRGSALASLVRLLRSKAYGLFSDEALLLRARAGDHMAFDAVVARYRDQLYSMAVGSLGDENLAGAALREMVLSALHEIDSFNAECSARSWLYLHAFRAVFKKMRVPPGRYTVESRPAARLASGAEG